MPSTFIFLLATVLLSLNFVRPLGLAISDWLYFGALGLALIETFLIERRNATCWWRNRFLWAMAIILFGAIISTMRSRYWGIALIEIAQQVFIVTLFTSLTWIMVRRGKTSLIISAFIVSGVFTASVVILDYFTGSNMGPTLSGNPNLHFWGRYAGTLGHPNKLGYFLALTVLLSIGRLVAVKRSRIALVYRFIWMTFILIQGFGIYLSGSMTAYLGVLLGVTAYCFFSIPQLLRSRKIIWAATITSFILLVGILSIGLFDSSFNLSNTYFGQALNRVQNGTAESRLEGYKLAWEQIAQHPWFGSGFDQMSTSGVTRNERYLGLSVHNPLLQIWYTGGIFAFIGWLAIYFSIGWMTLTILINRASKHLSPSVLAIAASALAILLMDQFQDAIYQREKWVVIGLLVGFVWEHPLPTFLHLKEKN